MDSSSFLSAYSFLPHHGQQYEVKIIRIYLHTFTVGLNFCELVC